MIALLGLLAVLTLVLWLAPHSPEGRLLHRALVEQPLAALSRLQLRHLIFIAFIGGFGLAGGEIFLLAGPELVTGFALELSIYLDAVIVTYALSAAAGIRRAGTYVVTRIGRPRRLLGARRKRVHVRRERAGPAANDYEHPAARRLAA